MAQNTYNASGNWTAPANLKNTTVQVELIGGGGGGAGSNNNTTGASGGGGGAYARSNVTVTAGNVYAFNIGTGGNGGGNNAAGNNGLASDWNNNAVMARGGFGAAVHTGGNGANNNGVGDVQYAGGAGYTVPTNTHPGGGGGASGGNAATGNTATSITGATGAGGGGSGGNGGANNVAGNIGIEPGGGGGGGGNRTSGNKIGGAGATGRAIITWTPATFNDWRQDIINGFASTGSETHGFNAEVRAKMGVSEVVRTSSTVCTITFAAEAGYDITAQETITLTLPGGVLTSGNNLAVTGTFTIDPTGGNNTVSPSWMFRTRYVPPQAGGWF